MGFKGEFKNAVSLSTLVLASACASTGNYKPENTTTQSNYSSQSPDSLNDSIVLRGNKIKEYQSVLQERRNRKWTLVNTLLGVGSTALIITDWGQTRYMGKHSTPEHHEINPILGPNPSRRQINSLFAVTIPLNFLIGYLMPNPWRNLYFSVVTMIEAYSVTQDFQAGVKFEF